MHSPTKERDEALASDEDLLYGVFPCLAALSAKRRDCTALYLQESLFDSIAVEQFESCLKRQTARANTNDRDDTSGVSKEVAEATQQLMNSLARREGRRHDKMEAILEAALASRVPVQLRSRKWLDQATTTAPHQGMSRYVSDSSRSRNRGNP